VFSMPFLKSKSISRVLY